MNVRSSALHELLQQHADLRELLDSCDTLADELDDGGSSPQQLSREVAKLRRSLDAHNKFEEELLHPLLWNRDTRIEVRISRLVDDHAEQQRAIRAHLVSTNTTELRAVVQLIRRHLETEEIYLVTDRWLHDASTPQQRDATIEVTGCPGRI